MSDLTKWCDSISNDELEFRQFAFMDSNCVPAAFTQKNTLESILSGWHDDRIESLQTSRHPMILFFVSMYNLELCNSANQTEGILMAESD